MLNALAFVFLAAQIAPLTAGETIRVSDGGKFDYMQFDKKYDRILAAHAASSALTVYDLKSKKVMEIQTGGEINGIAVSDKMNRIFVGGGGNIVIALDQKTLKPIKSITLTGPGDDIVLDEGRNELYVCHDEATEDWVFDATTLELKSTVTVGKAPEFIIYDKKSDKVYQNVKTTDSLQVIDPQTHTVMANWNSAPMKGPHGMAIDFAKGRVFSAGSNGKLDVFDIKTSKLLQTIDVKTGIDQIAMDQSTGMIYCAAKGFISVVRETRDGAELVADVASPAGAHTITVDTRTHDVWICYANKTGSFLQVFHV